MSIELSPWDNIETFGNPWHGKMAANGTLTLANGATKSGVAPKTAGATTVEAGNLFGRTSGSDGLATLVKFDGIGAAPAASAAEAVLGMRWDNYAILNSSNRQYSPMANAGLGDGAWLYRTSDLEVWTVRAVGISSNVLRVSARRLNVPGEAFVTLLDHAIPAGSALLSNIPFVTSKPSGKEATVNVCDVSSNVAYVTLTLTGGTKDAPPTVAAATALGQLRAVSGDISNGNADWSKEEFACVRYLADGSRREIWLGSSHAITGGTVEIWKSWFWLGAQKVEAITQTRTNSLGVFTGSTDFFGTVYNYQANSSNDTPSFSFANGWKLANRGVECILQLPSGIWKGVCYGVLEAVQKTYEANVFGGASIPTFCEHPVTGQFVDGAVWIF